MPLDQVTTPSLQALRLYSQSTYALHYQADRAKGRALLEEAIALDSTFAAALVRLGIEYGVIGEYGRAAEMQTRAFRHRDRLGERERAFTSAIYYTGVTHEYDRAVAAYLTALEVDPTDVLALNNLAFIYADLREFARAEEFYTRALRADSSIVVVWNGLQQVLINQGKLAEARRVIDRAHARFPGNLHLEYTEIYLAVALGDYAGAARHARLMVDGSPDDAIRRADGYRTLADVALLQGKVDDIRPLPAHGDASRRGRRLPGALSARRHHARGRRRVGAEDAAFRFGSRGAARPLSARLDRAARPTVRRARRRVFGDGAAAARSRAGRRTSPATAWHRALR